MRSREAGKTDRRLQQVVVSHVSKRMNFTLTRPTSALGVMECGCMWPSNARLLLTSRDVSDVRCVVEELGEDVYETTQRQIDTTVFGAERADDEQ